MRFIELMPMGENGFGKEAYLPYTEVLRRLPELEPRPGEGGAAKLYRLPGALGNVGLISPVSAHSSAGSADCADPAPPKKSAPSVDAWLREAKAERDAGKIGMYLLHNGTVRRTARAAAREGREDLPPVRGMEFSYDQAKVDAAVRETKALPGVSLVRVWLASGELKMGDDIMYVLIGGDIRPRVMDALDFLVGRIKSECVVEKEVF